MAESTLRARYLSKDRLDAFVTEWDSFGTTTWGSHLDTWTARYSRGDGLNELRAAFAPIVDCLLTKQERLFEYRRPPSEPRYSGVFYDELVVLSLATCLRQPRGVRRGIAAMGVRGDALIETVARGQHVDRELDRAFPLRFSGLYAIVDSAPPHRPELAAAWLADWRNLWRVRRDEEREREACKARRGGPEADRDRYRSWS